MSATGRRPLYARVLRLRRLRPSSLLCFLFFEGMVAVGVLLALAELVSWWAVPALPLAVAAMVKLNDVVAAALVPATPGPAVPGPAVAGRAAPGRVVAVEPVMGHRDVAEPVVPAQPARQVSRDLAATLDPVDSPRQRFRQSARRRYE